MVGKEGGQKAGVLAALSAGRASTWWPGGGDVTRRGTDVTPVNMTAWSAGVLSWVHVLAKYSFVFVFYGFQRPLMDEEMFISSKNTLEIRPGS